MKDYVGPLSGRPAMRPEAPRADATGNDLRLELADEYTRREGGYNPYNSIAHARATRGRDIWRDKPKRA